MDCPNCIRSPVYIRCSGSLDLNLESSRDSAHTNGHFPQHQHPGRRGTWQYTGLNPEELEGRITSVYERALTSTVDNIEHIESTTLNGQSIVKLFLQPNAGLDTANAQVTAIRKLFFANCRRALSRLSS